MPCAECGYGLIACVEDIRAGEDRMCLAQCITEGDEMLRIRVQSGPTGWVYSGAYPRTEDGYARAWSDAKYALRMWWANNRNIRIDIKPWYSVAWSLRGLEEVTA